MSHYKLQLGQFSAEELAPSL